MIFGFVRAGGGAFASLDSWSPGVESMPTLLGGWTVPFVAAVGLACYLNCVICEFVFDDRFAIVTNKDIYPGAPTRAPC